MKLERNSGILLHPTSLPDSTVCGSFGKPARAWLNELAEAGIGVWQFLPLAPTDSFGSPYSSPSSFAFNPWFLDQNDLVRDGFLANNLEKLNDFIIRFGFWSVLIIGIVDAIISFLIIENFLEQLIGKSWNIKFSNNSFRAPYVHFPLLFISLIIAYYFRALNFYWLAFLVVIAEFQIVILRFVFSYEQTLMSDLVRFWYGSLFLSHKV